MVDIQGANLVSFRSYLESLSASSTGVSTSAALNTAGSAVVGVTPPTLNLQDFRATGDSDWSAAMQRAYDAAMATSYGAEIFIPPPSVGSDQYEISTQIDCELAADKQVVFNGGGYASRIKVADTLTNSGVLNINVASPVAEGFVHLRNLSIVGHGDDSVGVELENANGIRFQNVRFYQLETAVLAASTYGASFEACRFRDIRGHGFHSTTSAHHTSFHHCKMNTVGRDDDVAAIIIDAASDNVILAFNDIEGGEKLIEMPGGRALTVLGNYIEFYDGELFTFSSTMYGARIDSNWIGLSANQSLANMNGGSFCYNSIYDEAPNAMTFTPATTFVEMLVQGNRVHGTASFPSGTDFYYIGAGTETTQMLPARTLSFQSMTPGASVVADQFIGGVAFRNSGNVAIAGIGGHYKVNADGSQSYILIEADNVADAFKVEGSNATGKGAVTDIVGRLQAMPRSTTAALAAIGNAINTTNKFSGKVVINTTSGAIVTANGSTAGSTWLALDGTTAHTPV